MSQSLTGTTGQMRTLLKSANAKIFRALLSIASAALFIRVMGMFNQVIVTDRFGEGAAMDAYFVASMLPLLLAQLIQGALEASVIPVYSRVRAWGGKEQASILFSTLLNLLILSSVLLTVLMLIFRRQIILISAPALNPLSSDLAYTLTPFIFPVLLLMVIVGFLECILNAEGQFGWPAYAGMVIPVTTAILVFAFGKSQGVIMLCVGTLIGLCLQFGIILVRAQQANIVYRPIIDLRSPEIASILAAAWPVMIGALISQASPLIDQVFASFLSTGSISALNYALKLISVPTGIIFVSVGRAAMPYLSRQAVTGNIKAFKETLRLYLWGVSIGTTILSAFMLVLAHPLVQILFQRGTFTAADTNRTAITLMGFVIGLTPMAICFFISKAFGALGKTRVLMRVAIFSVIANALLDYILAYYWQGFGIALATSVMYTLFMFILLFSLRRTIGKLDLFTPPIEVVQMIRKIRSSYALHQQIIRISIVLLVFIVGIAGVLQNALYTLRISLGASFILAFLRYHYALLITWVLIDTLDGSTLTIFYGNNLDTGLTVSTLLLMTRMPIKDVFKRMPALAFLLIFLLWVFAGIGISPLTKPTFLVEWLLRLDYIAVSVLTIQVLNTRKRLLGLIDAILLLTTLISLYGIYGYFTKQNGDFDGSISYLFRIGSIFGTGATSLAFFLSLIIPLAIYRACTLRGFKMVVSLMVILLFFVAFVLTFTRTAFISVPISIIIMSLFLPSRKLKAWLLGITFALAIIVVLWTTVNHVPVFSRFLEQDVSSFNGRTYLWQALLDNFDPTQLLGNGLDASYALLDRLQVGYGGVIGTSPHNLFLGTLYDQGIIGLTLLIAVFLALFINLITGMRKAVGEQRILFAVALGVLTNTILLCLDASDIWNQGLGLYFWIIVALPFALCWSPSREAPRLDEDEDGDISDTTTEPEMVGMAPAGGASSSTGWAGHF